MNRRERRGGVVPNEDENPFKRFPSPAPYSTRFCRATLKCRCHLANATDDPSTLRQGRESVPPVLSAAHSGPYPLSPATTDEEAGTVPIVFQLFQRPSA